MSVTALTAVLKYDAELRYPPGGVLSSVQRGPASITEALAQPLPARLQAVSKR